MSTPPILPVVLCGGAGRRLWPLSTEARPKPFHAIGSDLTLFQHTILRTKGAQGFLPPVVICGRAHRGLVEAQMAQVGVAPTALVLEPCGRGTAAVAAVAASLAQERCPGALVLLAPADHRIADEAAFVAAITSAAASAGELIVTFGVSPTGPATGYGYIERGEAVAEAIFRVKRFVEKPDAAKAQGFLRSGRYSWNAGIFLGAAQTLLGELKTYRPDIAEAARAAFEGAAGRGEMVVELSKASFAACPLESFDRAVMEHTAKAAVAPCDIGWADIGSWAEVWRLGKGDGAGNLIEGGAVVEDARDCLVLAQDLPVAVLGVTGLVVVVTPDGVLVAPKARAQEVGALVGRLARQGGSSGESEA